MKKNRFLILAVALVTVLSVVMAVLLMKPELYTADPSNDTDSSAEQSSQRQTELLIQMKKFCGVHTGRMGIWGAYMTDRLLSLEIWERSSALLRFLPENAGREAAHEYRGLRYVGG